MVFVCWPGAWVVAAQPSTVSPSPEKVTADLALLSRRAQNILSSGLWARCAAWASEAASAGQPHSSGDDGGLSRELRQRLSKLAASWLLPHAPTVVPADLVPRNGDERPSCSSHDPGRLCPLVIVRRGQLFVHISPKSRLFEQSIACDLGRATSMHRLLTVLRHLRALLKRQRLPEFDLRVCCDDFCHGLHERRPVPWVTMASCRSMPSLPAVHWNTERSSDAPLAIWDEVLLQTARGRDRYTSRWHLREGKAVWRGALSDEYVVNMKWSEANLLETKQYSSALWRQQGRLALLGQACEHPELLDVHLVGNHERDNLGNHGLVQQDAAFPDCMYRVNQRAEATRHMSMEEQAWRFKYAVHVEGVGGWADRLKHLLRSGMLVLKQDSGVNEWFEPMLEPWVHYVPISSTLHNLSAAIRWAHANDDQARRIANAGAELMDKVLSVQAMTLYQEALFHGYAAMYNVSKSRLHRKPIRPGRDWPLPSKQPYHEIPSTAAFTCDTTTPSGASMTGWTKCYFMDVNRTIRATSMAEFAQLRGVTRRTKVAC